MDRSEILTLISANYTQDGLGQWIPDESRKDVFCNVSSVSADEFFAAGREGFQPEYRFTIFAPEYSGEKIVEYKGRRYGVYRHYLGKNEQLELYAEEKAGVTG